MQTQRLFKDLVAGFLAVLGRLGLIIIVSVQKIVPFTLILILYHRAQIYVVNALEDIRFDEGIRLAELRYKLLYLLPLRYFALVFKVFVALGKTAGAADKVQVVMRHPAKYVGFLYHIHRADKLHALVIFRVQLRHHGLYLSAIYHAHKYRFDNVVEMMTQRYFIAAKALRVAVKMSAAHTGAHIAGVFIQPRDVIEDIHFKYLYRYTKQRGVVLNFFAVLGVVAGIHHYILSLELFIGVFLQVLYQLRHKHRILAAGDTDGYFIAVAYHLIIFQPPHEFVPYILAVCGYQAAFSLLRGGKLSCLLFHFPFVRSLR